MSDEVDAVKGSGFPPIIDSKAIQDILAFVYSRAGNEKLSRDLGSLGDAIKQSKDVLNALNKLNTVATLLVDKDDLNYKAEYTDSSGPLWANRSLVREGYIALNNIIEYTYDNPVASDGTLLIASEQLEYLKVVRDQVSDVGNDINNMSKLKDWFNSTESHDHIWDTQTNITIAIQQFEFLNTQMEDQLREAMFIYQEFVTSAASALTKLNKIYLDMGQQIG